MSYKERALLSKYYELVANSQNEFNNEGDDLNEIAEIEIKEVTFTN
jgi:hypothetical protein